MNQKVMIIGEVQSAETLKQLRAMSSLGYALCVLAPEETREIPSAECLRSFSAHDVAYQAPYIADAVKSARYSWPKQKSQAKRRKEKRRMK